jgi:peroxiredoxin
MNDFIFQRFLLKLQGSIFLRLKEVGYLLKTGDKAPDFTLPSTLQKDISLSDFKGKKNVLVAFYPLDFTPG